MDVYTDLHTHTTCSWDGEASLAAYCQSAKDKGFTAFALTEHGDVNVLPFPEIRTFILKGAADIRREQEKNPPFSILQGLELGEPLEDPAFAEGLMGLLPYDYILGSIHNIPGKPDFYYIDYTQTELRCLLVPYFQELIRLAQWGKFDAVAHITYPLRYIEGKYHIKADLSPYSDLIDQLFRTMISKGLALEVNSSGLRQGLDAPLPDKRFLRRYYELGGRNLVFGSDSHKSRDFGAGIGECMALCREIGFTTGCYYQNRQAVEFPLPAPKGGSRDEAD